MPDQRLTLEQLVHRASKRLQTQTDLSADTRVELLRTLGEVSMAGSDYAEAGLLYNQALAAARTFHAPTDKALTQIQLLQASLLIYQSRYADASIAYEALLPQMRKSNDAASVEGLQNYSSALMYSARTDKALAIAGEAARNAAALYGAGSTGAVKADLVHANLLVGSGYFADAAPMLDSALQAWRDSKRAPTEDFLQGLTDLSRVHQAFGRSAAAEALLRETLATAEQLYDAPHDRIALALLNLGDTLRLQERLDEAESVLTRALAMMQAIYGKDHLRVANTLGSLGKVELRRRDLAAAADHIHAAVHWCEKPGLHATRSCIALYAEQAELALAEGDLDGADASSARALAMAQEIFHQGHHWMAHLWQLRAESSLRRNDAPAALAYCDRARELLTRLGEENGLVAEGVLARRARVLDALGRPAEALADIKRALGLWQQLAPAGHLHEIELLDVLAATQAGLGDAQSSRDSARRAMGLIGVGASLRYWRGSKVWPPCRIRRKCTEHERHRCSSQSLARPGLARGSRDRWGNGKDSGPASRDNAPPAYGPDLQ
jgi:tetratricopeptide (TPR) repeat protein